MATAQEKMQLAAEKIEANKDRVKEIGAVYKFVLSGEGGGTWILDLRDDPGVREGEGDAQCTLKLSAKDYVDMMDGKAKAQQLFFESRLTIEGDIGLAMKLQKLMELLA